MKKMKMQNQEIRFRKRRKHETMIPTVLEQYQNPGMQKLEPHVFTIAKDAYFPFSVNNGFLIFSPV